MADDKEKAAKTADADAASEATSEGDSKRKRRVLRAAEPETLREQSEKAQARSNQPRKLGKPARAAAKPFVMAGRGIAKVFRPLGRFKFFRAVGYVLYPPYFRNAVKELRLVTWPDRRKTWRLTYAVIVFSVAFGLIVAGVDFALDKLFREFILK